MTTVIKDPFTYLDTYQEEAFVWATNISRKIDLDRFSEKDPLIISVSFAYIFSVFIHLTMNYFLIDFESYFEENDEKTKSDSWKRMHDCVGEIYSATMLVYKDPMEIYKTLYNSILIERPDEYSDNELATIKIEPYDYKEIEGFGYVSQGFNY